MKQTNDALCRLKKYYYAEYQFSQSAYGILSDLMATLTGHFGFSVSASNLLMSVGNFTIPLQIFGTARYLLTRNRGRFLRLSISLWRILLPLIFFCVRLPGSVGAAAMAIFYTATVACYQFSVSPYTEWVITTVGERVSENFYMVRSTIWLITYTVASLFVGIYVDRMREMGRLGDGIGAVGCIMAVLIAASLICFLRCPVDAEHRGTSEKLTEIFGMALKNRAFLRVMCIYAAATLSAAFFNGFATLYRVRVLDVGLFELTLWSTVGYVLRVLISPWITAAARRIGWARILGLTYVLMAATSACFALASADGILLPVLSVLIVMPHTVYEVGYLKLEIAATPQENRSVYFTVKALSGCVVSVLASLICTALIGVLEARSPELLRYLFFIGAFGLGICTVLCFRLHTISNHDKGEMT